MDHRTLANALRVLAMDAVQRANSGHPGMPMGMADIATVLWREFLNYNPQNPSWHNRDRFILSNGHGSMLLYGLLYLSGYDMTIEDIKNFRRLGSHTPGHPEVEIKGVETTTGPLGQGLANAIGMALAERNLAAEFNRSDLAIVSHHTYVFVGDGCLMEGISHEACSFAGMQKLGKLICFFDNNQVSIDGEVKHWCVDDTAQRFASYKWHVIDNIDGHNPVELRTAIKRAQEEDHPSLLICSTSIGYGSPNKAGKASAHGSPLGQEEVELVRTELGWHHPPFVIPPELLKEWDMKERGAQLEQDWQNICTDYKKRYPTEWNELERRLAGELPSKLITSGKQFITKQQSRQQDQATRASSLQTLEAYAPHLPELIGGSADLTDSNLTFHTGSSAISSTKPKGNYIYYGVRELAMSSMMNGIALHKGYIPYGGTFLVFLDYARSSVRLSALMGQRVIYVYTHDSIGIGEDGPTHQPIEHLTILRATPNINLWRPADAVETAVAWLESLKTSDRPSALALSRQKTKAIDRDPAQLAHIHKGGYSLIDKGDEADMLVIATGSEVGGAFEAVRKYNEEGGSASLVSMPCCELFAAQPLDYRNRVLPPKVTKRLAIEAGASAWWRSFVGLEGDIMGIDRFGFSAPADSLFEHFGFSATHIYERMKQLG